MDVEIGGETFHKEPNILEQIAYRDTWGRGADSFLSMLYERQAYLSVGGRLTGEQREQALAEREREFPELILRAYKAGGFDNEAFFDGKRNGRLVVIGPINLPVGRLFVEEVVTERFTLRARGTVDWKLYLRE